MKSVIMCETNDIHIPSSATTGQRLHQHWGGSWSNWTITKTLSWEECALNFTSDGGHDCNMSSFVSLQQHCLQLLYYTTSIKPTYRWKPTGWQRRWPLPDGAHVLASAMLGSSEVWLAATENMKSDQCNAETRLDIKNKMQENHILPGLYLRWRAAFSCGLQKWWCPVPSGPGLLESGMSGGQSESSNNFI